MISIVWSVNLILQFSTYINEVRYVAHSFHELYELMPKKDCGLCNNPSCRTMARKIATNGYYIARLLVKPVPA